MNPYPLQPTPLLDSYTQLYGVIGSPIRHSKSPIMFNRAFAECHVQAIYLAFDVSVGELPQAVRALRALQIGGYNVTIPHKIEVMSYLDDIDEHAKRIGAVNVVVNRDGKLIGYNTDGIGYTRSLQEETGVRLKGKRVLMIGAGGASRGVAYALAQAEIERLLIANRTRDKAEQLALSLRSYVHAEAVDIQHISQRFPEVDIIINTTSVGMTPHVDELPIALDGITAQHIVSDLIYNPRLTRFLLEARERGAQVHGGLGMLIYQGAYAFEYWTGQPAPVSAMREAVEQSLSS